MFRVKFYDGDRCWGVEHNQPADKVADLLTLWADTVVSPNDHIVIELAPER